METKKTKYFYIVLGGMGVRITGWWLARIVSMLGGLGTVSGVMLERVMANILQDGDPGGHIRRALKTFPFQKFAKIVLDAYFIEGGKKKDAKYKSVPMFTIYPSDLLISLTVCAVYSFVWLAKEGHKNPISINFLEKVAMTHIYAITGAMLAGVDFITMGAGLPFQIPKVMNDILEGKTVSYNIPVIGENIKSWTMSFNPEAFFGEKLPPMEKPKFLPIISSNFLAELLIKKIGKESIYAFMVELDSAGGHNATNKRPIDFARLSELGIPFYIGGATASPEMLEWALSVGAKGIQVGSIFALCEDSDMNPEIRKKVRRLGFIDKLKIRTDARISPTSFLFQVACVQGTLSEEKIYDSRKRKCNIGGLVFLYEKPDGTIGYRCPAEPEENFVEKKGGKLEDTVGRGCLCNGLFTTCGLGDPGEPPVVTLGIDFSFLKKLMKGKNDSYTAEDAFQYLMSNTK